MSKKARNANLVPGIAVLVIGVVLVSLSWFYVTRVRQQPVDYGVEKKPTATPLPEKLFTVGDPQLEGYFRTERDGGSVQFANFDEKRNINPDAGDIVISIAPVSGVMPTGFLYQNGADTPNQTINPFILDGSEGIRGYTTSPFGLATNIFVPVPNRNVFLQIQAFGNDHEAVLEEVLRTFKFTTK